ncbi:Dipeptidyl aminopeptidase [Entomortierella chlamydospora]|uniref:Dipeptidyl aminopeptidase n=1 Tax=Entomortierella chlamydospora TaxID=101097 RepID=A0A9P6MLZ9_9FUNG|nr:Dipeptidyl aminopeptidase [Entomortierella chlamydospora]
MAPTVAPYGEWRSPIDVNFITSSTVTISNLLKNEKTGQLFWNELSGATNGRTTIMTRNAAGVDTELTPAPFHARTRVHEYGGGAFTLGSTFLISSNDDDCRLYKVDTTTKEATPLTPENKAWRYADIEIHPSEKFLICVREDHTVDTPQTVVNTLVVVRLDAKEPNVEVASQTLLAGADKAKEESNNQPRFAADGTLYFMSDKTGFWNLYSYKAGGKVELVLQEPVKAEFQGPAWRFGSKSYYPLKSDPTKIASTYTKDGVDHLAIIDAKSKTLKDIPIEFQVIDSVYATTSGQDDALLLDVGSYNVPSQVISYNLRTNKYEVLMKSSTVDVPKGWIAKPEPLTFKTTGDLEAYALYYPPTNQDYIAPEGTLPPLRVLSHGGPTSAYDSSLSWTINYFTSRGIACVTVNYGGSTNYGREFRDRLRTKWGVVDVDDCCAAATYLVQRGSVDEKKLAIVGGSAGGYTTLACLAFRSVFKAGVSHYGIGDLEILAKDTHKFELLYPESLIGPYPAARDLYLERSPLYSADNITCPCAFFQGADDKVVPPNQAELMVNALKKRGLPVAYVLFEGEGHGFRIPKNVQAALQGEVSFIGRIFGFTPFDGIPIDIANESAIGK